MRLKIRRTGSYPGHATVEGWGLSGADSRQMKAVKRSDTFGKSRSPK